MKKSNKLLLAGFLAVVVLITAIHVSLYAKYKNGNYTIFHATDLSPQSMEPFPNVLFISIRNVAGATVTFSDVAAVEKVEEGNIQYVRKGDTLLITGREGVNRRDFDYPIEFHLPSNANLTAYNSSLSFKPGKTIVENNPVIYLKKSQAVFSGAENRFNLGQMKVVASDSSTVLFFGNTQISNLEVQLSNSSFEFGEGNIGQLSIITDSLSRLSLQSKHLLKANIKNITPQ